MQSPILQKKNNSATLKKNKVQQLRTGTKYQTALGLVQPYPHPYQKACHYDRKPAGCSLSFKALIRLTLKMVICFWTSEMRPP